MTNSKRSESNKKDTRVERSSASQYCNVPDQSFYFKVVGLKPNTYHNFYVSETEETARCQQTNKALAAGLQTDAKGIVTFRWFRNKTNSNSFETTDYTESLNRSNKVGSNAKKFQLKMLANGSPTMSYALGILPVELEPVIQEQPEPLVTFPIYANSLFPSGHPYFDEHPDWQLVPVVN